MRVSDIGSVAPAVPPEFHSGDLHSETWRLFSSCGRLTANPRVMVEEFLRGYLGADFVLGTEIGVHRGRATGIVTSPGVLVGRNKAEALKKAFSDSAFFLESKSEIPAVIDLSYEFSQKLCRRSGLVTRKLIISP